MEVESLEDRGGLAEGVRAGLHFMVTLGVAALGVVAVVALAGREDSREGPAPETLPTTAAVAAPQPTTLVLAGPPVPQAVIFLVSSESARAQIAGVLEAESTVRTTTHEPQRPAWVVVAESEAQAGAVLADAAIAYDSGRAIQVVDYR